MKKLVFDMDNVLANFEVNNALDRFDKEIGFFENLKPMYDNYKIVNQLLDNGIKCYVLSASPNEQADQDKLKWLKKYIPSLKRHQIVFCRLGENKAEYIKDIKNSVLIDDYSFNLINWLNHGGNCFKYLNGINGIKNTHKQYNIKELKNFNDLLTFQF